MSKNENGSNRIVSKKASNNIRGRVVRNSYGYDISNFNVLDMSVRRESRTGRLVSTNKQSSKKTLNDS